jgi:predicted small lipoprotein YifL
VRKQKNGLFVGMVMLILLVIAGCGEKEDFEAADKVAYEYIAASIEQDDDRKSEILTSEALEQATENDVLVPGRHDNADAEEELGDRYEIRRYDNIYNDKELYYRVKYAIPNNASMNSDTEYIKMVKDENEKWKLTLSTGILNDEIEKAFPEERNKEEGTLVHEYEN